MAREVWPAPTQPRVVHAWPAFNRELADKLLALNNNRRTVTRREIAGKIAEVYTLLGLKVPKEISGEQFTDLDPFTAFALLLYGRYPAMLGTRMFAAVKQVFELEAPLPSENEPLPYLLPYQHTQFYTNGTGDTLTDIEKLWLLFENALAYADWPSLANEEVFKICFDATRNIQGLQDKQTLGLYWLRPDFYMNFSRACQQFVFDDDERLRQTVHELAYLNRHPMDLTAKGYLALSFELEQPCKSPGFPYHSFVDIVEAARSAWAQPSRPYSKQKEAKQVRAEYEQGAQNNVPVDWSHGVINGKEEREHILSHVLPDLGLQEDNPGEAASTEAAGDVFMDPDRYEEIADLIFDMKNVVLQGPPGVGKTYLAQRLAYSLANKPANVCVMQFHEGYRYGDLLMAGRSGTDDVLQLREAPFYALCTQADMDEEGDYFFIMDDIGKGDIRKVMGELTFLIDASYRGERTLTLQTGEEFTVPPNLYIIGTLNTPESKSLGLTLRRRFAFVDLEPALDTRNFRMYARSLHSDAFGRVIAVVKQINEAIRQDPKLGKGYEIGHSYFCDLTSEDVGRMLHQIVRYQLIPLIEELWRHNPAARDEHIAALEDALEDKS